VIEFLFFPPLVPSDEKEIRGEKGMILGERMGRQGRGRG